MPGPMQDKPPPEPEGFYIDGEQARVYRHRLRAFERLGFAEGQAICLTDAGRNQHEAQRLLDLGCSLRDAVRILT